MHFAAIKILTHILFIVHCLKEQLQPSLLEQKRQGDCMIRSFHIGKMYREHFRSSRVV